MNNNTYLETRFKLNKRGWALLQITINTEIRRRLPRLTRLAKDLGML